jgi:hypothetical protein
MRDPSVRDANSLRAGASHFRPVFLAFLRVSGGLQNIILLQLDL